MSSNRKKSLLPLSKAYSAMLGKVRGEAFGLSRQRIFTIKSEIAHGDFPKEETMRDHLRQAGWRCVEKELWGI